MVKSSLHTEHRVPIQVNYIDTEGKVKGGQCNHYQGGFIQRRAEGKSSTPCTQHPNPHMKL